MFQKRNVIHTDDDSTDSELGYDRVWNEHREALKDANCHAAIKFKQKLKKKFIKWSKDTKERKDNGFDWKVLTGIMTSDV